MLFSLGCASSGTSRPDAIEGRRLFDADSKTHARNSGESRQWTIGLATFSGNDAPARAEAEADRLRSIPALRDVFVMDRGSRAIVCVGQHPSPSTAEALAQLKKVRAVTIAGERPFQHAFFIPPTGKAQDDLDLRRAPETFGSSAVYTLQVGVYGRADGKPPTEKDIAEARAKAEEAARELRRQGELAFYYHGPSMSMVTVGVFSHDDIDQGFSYELQQLKERFPYNLLNGQGVSQTLNTTQGRQKVLQESFPVLIPTQ
ncbi:MAG TPA: hypothetical protein ENJ00_10940 [Phycisphaerales bacterium]|nr:hypothetical protein [Phycisphaerales bacterium]